ncbi:hypothetical protein EDB19DRAFT_1834258 [Suillus lakei]|nr:hypothetical protein EDB19DRAFT_1834258 [Suillus lakei]
MDDLVDDINHHIMIGIIQGIHVQRSCFNNHAREAIVSVQDSGLDDADMNKDGAMDASTIKQEVCFGPMTIKQQLELSAPSSPSMAVDINAGIRNRPGSSGPTTVKEESREMERFHMFYLMGVLTFCRLCSLHILSFLSPYTWVNCKWASETQYNDSSRKALIIEDFGTCLCFWVGFLYVATEPKKYLQEIVVLAFICSLLDYPSQEVIIAFN